MMHDEWRMAKWGRGFSLMEILVVVGIVAVLVAILVPTLYQAKKRAARAAGQMELNGLAQALETYHDMLHAYPDSTPVGDITSGGAALAEALVGWRPLAEDGAGTPNDPDDYGFRLVKGGRGEKYGPFIVPTSKSYDAGLHVMVDHWGNTVLYYRAAAAQSGRVKIFGVSDGVFVPADNRGSPDGAADFLNLLGEANGNNVIDPGETIANRSSFLLVSPGPDGIYFTRDNLINGR